MYGLSVRRPEAIISLSLVGLLLVAAGIGYGVAAGLRPRARRIDERRSVLIHAPAEAVWERVRRVPHLLLTFGKLLDHARMEEPITHDGGGAAPGSRWRLRGQWEEAPYWLEVELLRIRPQRELQLRLAGDGFKTERGVSDHRGSLTLEIAGPDLTKLTWHLHARLTGTRLQARGLVAPAELRARLLDLKLRAIKVAVENEITGGTTESRTMTDRRGGGSETPIRQPDTSRPPESTL